MWQLLFYKLCFFLFFRLVNKVRGGVSSAILGKLALALTYGLTENVMITAAAVLINENVLTACSQPQPEQLIYPIKHFRDFLESKIRLDGRSFNKYRPIGVNIDSFINSLGSSAAKIGNSNVICGIRAELSKPRTHLSHLGYLIPNVDMTFSSPRAQWSNNHDLPEVLESIIYSIMNDSGCIKLEELCIQPGKLVWTLNIDIICLEVDGGIVDTVLLACAAALNNVKLPDVVYDESSNNIKVGLTKKELHVNTFPIISTYCIFDSIVLMDPTFCEESLANSLIHLGVNKDAVGLFHKNGGLPISKSEICLAADNAIVRVHEILNLLKRLKNEML